MTKSHADPVLGCSPLVLMSRILIDDGCWTWGGWHSPEGYGFMRSQGRDQPAHRVVYEFLREPIPDGLILDHLCRNRGCVNPWHLESVTTAVNIRRGTSPPALNVHKTYCPQGHPYDESNTYWSAASGRRCKVCNRAAARLRMRAIRQCRRINGTSSLEILPDPPKPARKPRRKPA